MRCGESAAVVDQEAQLVCLVVDANDEGEQAQRVDADQRSSIRRRLLHNRVPVVLDLHGDTNLRRLWRSVWR